ncbi:MAG: diphthine--ammonia ligase [Candidatus Thorarchaeota archaeon]
MSVLVSGGKDSVLALWIALHQFEVKSILTIRSSCPESFLFHIPNNQYVGLMAEMLEISHKIIQIDSCNIEDEINSLKEVLLSSSEKAIVTGGIRSEFQRYKFNRAAKLANMKCFNPLWRISPKLLLSELMTQFRIIITSVSSMGLGKEMLGSEFSPKILETLNQSGIELSLVGEGGEFETFVLDAPFFPASIQILESKVHWDQHRQEGYYEILKARSTPKHIL